MNKNLSLSNSMIIASSIDNPNSKNDFFNLIEKVEELPIREIEIESDYIDLIEKYSSILKNKMITVIINYPLGGYKPEYILDSIRWACEKKIDIICTSLPFFWLRSNESIRFRGLIKEIKNACEGKTLRISLESDLLHREEISTVCDTVSAYGIKDLKTSCGFSYKTHMRVISYIKKNYPNLMLTVDNDLRGNSIEIDKLLHLGVNYVCVKEPWLYHF